MKKSLEITEQLRKNLAGAGERSLFLESRLTSYRTMIDLQYSGKSDFETAFHFAEICRERELLDILTQSAGVKWKREKAVLELSASSTPLTLSQVRQSLPANAQLVEYAMTEKSLLIWVLTAAHWTTVSVPIAGTQLRQLVSDYLIRLQTRRDQQVLDAAARELYRLLIEPVAAHLSNQLVLAIVPDGILNALPWAALLSPDSGRYLIEDYSIVTNPSASVMIKMLEKGRARQKSRPAALLMVSNPKFDYRMNPSLKPLPASEREMTRIQPLYRDALNLSGDQAIKSTLLKQMGRFEVVQLSTHSIINEQNPLLSSIILAPDERSRTSLANGQPEQRTDDLAAHEIFRLRLPKTRLVILSSCHSVVSGRFNHNGLGGLAHAFFSAGVPTTIASLWEVDDNSTAELITEFHYFYRKEQMTFTQALRQAQLKLLKSDNNEWRHPYYWAAFLISGDGFTV